MGGDSTVTAHVTSQTNTSSSAKAGIMFRSSTDPGSPNYAVFATPGTGIKVQVRTTLGGTTSKIANPAGTVPVYLRVTRVGDTYTTSTSSDAVSWSAIPGSAYTVSLGATVLEGIGETSHNTGSVCTVTMDTVSIA